MNVISNSNHVSFALYPFQKVLYTIIMTRERFNSKANGSMCEKHQNLELWYSWGCKSQSIKAFGKTW